MTMLGESSRRTHSKAALVFTLALGLKAGQLASAGGVCDPAQGNVDGFAAFSVWPGASAPGGSLRISDPTGFETILVESEDPLKQRRFPAGVWILPPEGRYDKLLEGPGQISSWPTTIGWVHQPFRGEGRCLVRTMSSAGLVKVDSALVDSIASATWMLHANSNIKTVPERFLALEMLRHARMEEAAAKGVLMPVGDIAVAVYERASKAFRAVEVPVKVVAGTTLTVNPRPPVPGRADLILELTRPSVVDRLGGDDVEVAIAAPGEVARPPLFVTRGHRRVYAIWKELPATTLRLELSSKVAYLSAPEVALRSGRVEYVTKTLEFRKPAWLK